MVLIIALLPLWQGAPVRYWALAFCDFFLIAALVARTIVAPLNRLWTNVGLLLGRIVVANALGILYYGVRRLRTERTADAAIQQRATTVKFDREAGTYRIERTRPVPAAEPRKGRF